MFHFESKERRKWFRIQPSTTDPIVVRFGEEDVQVRDIGAAGLSFSDQHFSAGETRSSLIDLPGLGPTIQAELTIVSIDKKNACHCEFKEIQEPAVERIHQYVLKRQKEILQEKREKEKEKHSLINR
jgi:hypothetical protein